MAYCGIQWGLHRQAGFCPLHTGLHLGDERGGAGHTAAPRLPGCVRQGGHGENWGTTGSSLVLGFQAPYCVEPATWGEACSSDCLPSPPRDATAPMLEYELEKFPQSMRQRPKIAVPLRPPSSMHWNIESDLMFTITVDTNWQRLEAKRAAQDPEQESAGAEESPRETPVPKGAPPAIASSGKAASPMETTRQGEDLEASLGAVNCIHTLRLHMMNYMGSMKEIAQAAIHTLMAEFARLQTIICEDLTKSLSALCLELEASSEVLSADLLNVLNLRPGHQPFSWVRELIQRHHQSVTMKVNLPLIELEAVKEDLDRFLQECLRELGSNPRAQEVLEEITQAQTSYNRKDGATRSDQQDQVGPICGTTHGGCSSARNPGWVVRETRHDASRCG